MDPIYVTPCSCPHSSRRGTTKSWYLWALCPMSQRAGESRGEIGRMRSVVIDWTLSSTPDCSLVAPDLAKLVKLATSATESLPSSVQCWYQRVVVFFEEASTGKHLLGG